MGEQKRIRCPKCPDIVMMRRYYSPLKLIEIDECPGCAGIWLDTGELSKIHNNELSAAELARLKMEMIEQIAPPNIEAPKSSYSYRHGNNGNLEHVVNIASSLFY